MPKQFLMKAVKRILQTVMKVKPPSEDVLRLVTHVMEDMASALDRPVLLCILMGLIHPWLDWRFCRFLTQSSPWKNLDRWILHQKMDEAAVNRQEQTHQQQQVQSLNQAPFPHDTASTSDIERK
uniref:Uncharacterized protein n=1 Tax=Anopheles epiroticus TaxID=199890 RepID=A0A182PHY5_9DIPT